MWVRPAGWCDALFDSAPEVVGFNSDGREGQYRLVTEPPDTPFTTKEGARIVGAEAWRSKANNTRCVATETESNVERRVETAG